MKPGGKSFTSRRNASKRIVLLSVQLKGSYSSSSQGNVFAYNPHTDVFGPVCGHSFGKNEVRPRFGMKLNYKSLRVRLTF